MKEERTSLVIWSIPGKRESSINASTKNAAGKSSFNLYYMKTNISDEADESLEASALRDWFCPLWATQSADSNYLSLITSR